MKPDWAWGLILLAAAALPACGKDAVNRVTGDTSNAGTAPSGLDPALVDAVMRQVYGLTLTSSGGGSNAPAAFRAASTPVDYSTSYLNGTIRYTGTISYSTPTANSVRYDYDYTYTQKDLQVSYGGTLYLISGSQKISATYTYETSTNDYSGDQRYAGTFSVLSGDIKKAVAMDVKFTFTPANYSWSGTVDGRAVSGSI